MTSLIHQYPCSDQGRPHGMHRILLIWPWIPQELSVKIDEHSLSILSGGAASPKAPVMDPSLGGWVCMYQYAAAIIDVCCEYEVFHPTGFPKQHIMWSDVPQVNHTNTMR